MKLKLPNVTLIGIDCINVERLSQAMDICQNDIEFGKVKLLTSLATNDSRLVRIKHLSSISEYSDFCISELNDFVDTEFVLIVQHDGFILNPESWEDDFLKYDYVGAPWININKWMCDRFKIPEELFGKSVVGNGGFCIRSKKFLSLSQTLSKQGKIVNKDPEDIALCIWYRDLFEKEGIKFAPMELAERFSLEGKEREFSKQFGFHGFRLTKIMDWIDKHSEYKLVYKTYKDIWKSNS